MSETMMDVFWLLLGGGLGILVVLLFGRTELAYRWWLRSTGQHHLLNLHCGDDGDS